MGYFLGQHNPSNYFALTIVRVISINSDLKYELYIYDHMELAKWYHDNKEKIDNVISIDFDKKFNELDTGIDYINNALFSEEYNKVSSIFYSELFNGAYRIFVDVSAYEANDLITIYAPDLSDGTYSTWWCNAEKKSIAGATVTFVNHYATIKIANVNQVYLRLNASKLGEKAELKEKSVGIKKTIEDIDSRLSLFNTNETDRILLISDIHFGGNRTDSPLEKTDTLVDEIVDAIKYEHMVNPITAIFIVGDLLNNRRSSTGAYYDFKSNASAFVNRLKSLGFKVFVLHGNHDTYTLNEWKNTFGNGVEYVIESESYRLICANTFGFDYHPDDADPNMDTADPIDIGDDFYNKVINVMDKDEKPTFLVCHYPYTTTNVSNLMSRSDVIGIFAGHIHAPLNTTFSGKPLWLDGSFASLEDGYTDWTFRILESCCGILKTYTVVPKLPFFANELNHNTERVVGEEITIAITLETYRI